MIINRLKIKRILIILSISLNICFIYLTYQKRILVDEYTSGENNKEILESVKLDKSTFDSYQAGTNYTYYQLFHGKWKIEKQIGSDLALPSRYSGFNDDGSFRGPDTEKIIGKELIFSEDYVEYLGKKHSYAYGPFTYTHALFSENDEIGYNYAKTLGITGEYYSIVYFLLPNNYQVNSNQNHINELRIDDIRLLYLKDNDTIYASDGVITYLLKRLT